MNPSAGPRRVLLIEANEDGTVGGSHQALYDIVRHMDRSRFEPVLLFYQENRFAQALREEGFEVHLFEDVRAEELAVRRGGGRVRRTLDMVAAIGRRRDFLRRVRADLVHINNSPLVGQDDWLPAARVRRIPIVAHAMGDANWSRQGRAQRWLARRFDRVIPISEFMTRAMVANGVPEDRLTPMHLGVDLEAIRARVQRSRDEVRAELGVPEGSLLAVMVGNVREWKGQHVLLSALAGLTPEERQGVRVAFAGAVDGASQAYFDGLRAFEAEHDLGETVSWLGSRRDVPDLFAAADLAVHCSVRPEPFGLVVTEAMALGAPVAAAGEGGPAEVVTPTSGWLYDAARPEQLTEVLRSALSDPGMLAARSRGARERALEFSVDHTVRKVEEAYERALNPLAS